MQEFDPAADAATEAHAYPLLVGRLLTQALAVNGAQEITYQGRVRYTYARLRERIAQLANTLASLGATRGTPVAILDWDSHRYLEAYFAVPMMGATMMTVNVRLSPQQIAYTLNDAAAPIAIVHRDFVPMLEQIRDTLPHLRTIVVAEDDGGPVDTTLDVAGEYEALMAQAATQFDFPEFDERTRAATFYTTGTTGDPKGVFYSHRQIVLHALMSASALCSPRAGQRLDREDVYMPVTPMFHVLAWGMPYLAVMLGLKIVLPGRYLPERLLALKRSERVTFSHCVPTVLQMLLDAADAQAADLSGWTILIGGSALSPALCGAALARGIDVFAGYGMSETGPIVALAQLPPGAPPAPDDSVRLRCRTGRPVPLVELRIVDDAARDLPRDGRAQGEIVLRGPSLTQGYRGKPADSDALWAGGYLHTQDVAVIGQDGYVQIVDRLKDVIKTGGEWVSSIDVEARIAELPEVRECAVIGVPDAKWGERPLAVIVPRDGASLSADAVRAHLLGHADANRISRYAVPEAERIVFADALPKTSVGKLDKRRLRERIA